MDARLGRYELVARLASGGMGEIFLARLEGAAGFEKPFAIKRILPQFATDARFRKMLIAEAQIASKLAHSNICQVNELGETAGQLYLVMEYLEGVTLLALLRARARRHEPLELGFVAGVMLQICDALHYAHELRDRDGAPLGVVHRDVTLANVFVCESGTAKVLDFGIAKVKDAQATQTDTVKGKYAYMAPEQLRGDPLDRRVDVFALGVVLYEMLALRRLFQRPTDYLTFHAVLEQPLPDLRRYRPDAPDAVVAAVTRALSRDARDRPATTRELASAIADACRPWPQERIGELVRAAFADERTRRAAVLAAAPPGGLPDLAPASSEDDDDAFPSVETEAGPIGNETRSVVERINRAAEPPASAPRRSRTGLAIALALVALAGAGAAAVYAMQRQGPAPEIVVDKSDAPTRESDMKAVTPHMGALADCARKHPSGRAKATIDLEIGPDGRIASTSITPPELDRALGACLVGVLRTIAFPPRNAASLFSLDIAF